MGDLRNIENLFSIKKSKKFWVFSNRVKRFDGSSTRVLFFEFFSNRVKRFDGSSTRLFLFLSFFSNPRKKV
jgi:hypothetical protein